tara:strand:- start:3603 stop:3839 length:237 start_codon:yes stop_codon:yes gene_type:complete
MTPDIISPSKGIKVHDKVESIFSGQKSICHVWSIPSEYFDTFILTVVSNEKNIGIDKCFTIHKNKVSKLEVKAPMVIV